MNAQTEPRNKFWSINAGHVLSVVSMLFMTGVLYQKFQDRLDAQGKQIDANIVSIEEMRRTENRLSETTAVLASIIEHQQHGPPFRPPQ